MQIIGHLRETSLDIFKMFNGPPILTLGFSQDSQFLCH